MKKMLPLLLIASALLGYIAGYASKPSRQPILSGHFDDLSMIPSANAQENKSEVMPFHFNSPQETPLRPTPRRSRTGISTTFTKRTPKWPKEPPNWLRKQAAEVPNRLAAGRSTFRLATSACLCSTPCIATHLS